jgi:cytochrome P450
VAANRKYDLYSDEFRAQTYETFARMRESDPVLCQPGIDGETPIWFVTRHEDVVSVLLDDERFVRDPRLALTPEELEASASGMPESFAFIDNHMLNKDGADHRRLRRLVTKAFTPRMVEQLRPRIQEIADDLIDAVEPRRSMDLVDEFAFPLPMRVIAELLGIPHDDRDRFRAWSNAIVSPALSAEALARLGEQMSEFVAYLRDLFERRRAEPREDLISALLQAEDAGDVLAEQELFSMVVLLIVAGHETTVNLIANAILAMLGHPSQWAALTADPQRVSAVVEETLRYDPPVQLMGRIAAEDMTIGGADIPKGDVMILLLAAAHRDPAAFDRPDEFDPDRDTIRHLGFGKGPHFCLGAPLARLEAAVALTKVTARFPQARLVGEPQYKPNITLRGLASLDVAI